MLNNRTFQQSLAHLQPSFREDKFLLAVSGGADSMVLFHLFKAANLNFEVAHVNYKLRGNESEDDEELVRKICRKNKIPFHLYKVSDNDEIPENSVQTWARDLRYRFFKKIQREENLKILVTAHHLNDELETFLINLSKAAGIKGLSGIPANDNNILRPLLRFYKEEIYAFAKENKIIFREDVSNQKSDYLRNRIRKEIVPQLTEINENFLENFGKSLSYLAQAKEFVQEKILAIENDIIKPKDDSFLIQKKNFLNQSDFVQFEVLSKFGFNSLEEINKIKEAETGKTFISRDWQILIDREIVCVKRLNNTGGKVSVKEVVLTVNKEHQIVLPEERKTEIEVLGSCTWEIDGDNVQFPLKLRRKKTGDLFYPRGMKGRKKISKFFKDEKIPIFAQQKIWLLCDAQDEVLGILPFRQDRRFAADQKTAQIIILKL